MVSEGLAMGWLWKAFVFSGASAFLVGCATLVSGTDQDIAVDTPGDAGAECVLRSEGIGEYTVVTPATLKVSRSKHDIHVNCTKGCLRGSGLISSNLEGTTAGNLLLGGIIGAGIDSASGALNKYTSHTSIALAKVDGCRG
jgi:hypothetical protein